MLLHVLALQFLGISIPQEIINITRLSSTAKFILIVEKDAAFQKLLDEDILNKLGPLIIITVILLEFSLGPVCEYLDMFYFRAKVIRT